MQRQVTVEYALQQCARLYLEKCSIEDENAQLRSELAALKARLVEGEKTDGDTGKLESYPPEVSN